MKKTGINKDGWEVKKLGEVCTGKGEYGSGSSAIAFDKSKPRYIRITDIKENGELNDEKVSPSGSDFDEYELSEGDILFARSGATVGKTYIHNEKNGYCIYAGYLIRFVVDRKVMLPKFLFHYTRSAFYNDWIKSQQRVVAQPNINAKQYGDLPIIVPPLPAQSAIVAELDSLHRLKGLQEQQLEEYDKLAQSIFYSMFGDPIENDKGWEVKKLGEICDVRDGTHDSPKYQLEGFPLITSKNIVSGKISFDNVNLISKEDFDAINKRSKVDFGDILMPMIGTIGNPVINDTNKEFAIKNVALIKCTNSKEKLNLYIKYTLDSPSFKEEYSKLILGGTQKFLSLGIIRNLEIPISPFSLQFQFAQRIEKIETQKELVKQSIAQTEQLINYTMDKYFG
ncbi:MAG: hypothetical protein A2W86_07250 [Bacteroidetes bacterium GWD2_45_23]|nr:MAG: hypothetical protein A2W87_03605 [Bacteroidetes bacterium GWC2_46_850]OFX82374.1 MAG: hypothetical protein A2W86_07250 [Bacteroidetes bacterium GWD2_45_23]HBB01011.1 restriction endonuclease subunit S [Porphyromonadaceae bacterium]HCC18858.1 restriction endonuclease subunit S [Porphyromonadaceae bacterium]